MTNYFNPSVAMRNTESGNSGALGIKNNQLAVWDKTRGARIIARNWIVIERQPVAGWLTGILLDAWLQFAHEEPGGGYNSGGLGVLDDIHDVLMSAGLIDADGQPRKAMTPLLGAGGMAPEKDGE